MADQSSALIDALRLRPHGCARLVDGQHDRPGARCPPSRPGATPHPLRQLPRQRLDRPAPRSKELNAFESGEPQKVMAAIFPADQTAAQNTYLAAISSYPPAPQPPTDVLAAQKHAIDTWWNGSDTAGNKSASITAPTLIADGTLDLLDPTTNSQTLTKLIDGATQALSRRRPRLPLPRPGRLRAVNRVVPPPVARLASAASAHV